MSCQNIFLNMHTKICIQKHLKNNHSNLDSLPFTICHEKLFANCVDFDAILNILIFAESKKSDEVLFN